MAKHTAGIAMDEWKLPVFERHLTQAGYTYERAPDTEAGLILLLVPTTNLAALGEVVKAACNELDGVGPRH